jgi:hypothetical protein
MPLINCATIRLILMSLIDLAPYGHPNCFIIDCIEHAVTAKFIM